MMQRLSVINPDEHNILEINSVNFSNYSHLFRPSERRPFLEFIRFLEDVYSDFAQANGISPWANKTMEMYLGGGVIKNPLFLTPGRTHSDIDILAVGHDNEILEQLINGFILASARGKPLIRYGRGASEVHMGITLNEDNLAYFGIPLEGRFSLNITKPQNSKASPIDLCLANHESFKNYLGGYDS